MFIFWFFIYFFILSLFFVLLFYFYSWMVRYSLHSLFVSFSIQFSEVNLIPYHLYKVDYLIAHCVLVSILSICHSTVPLLISPCSFKKQLEVFLPLINLLLPQQSCDWLQHSILIVLLTLGYFFSSLLFFLLYTSMVLVSQSCCTHMCPWIRYCASMAILLLRLYLISMYLTSSRCDCYSPLVFRLSLINLTPCCSLKVFLPYLLPLLHVISSASGVLFVICKCVFSRHTVYLYPRFWYSRDFEKGCCLSRNVSVYSQ